MNILNVFIDKEIERKKKDEEPSTDDGIVNIT